MTNQKVDRDFGIASAIPPEQSVRHFTQDKLAHRWSLSPRTLERWRWLKQGPSHVKVGGRVVYRLVDIEEWERAHLRPSQD